MTLSLTRKNQQILQIPMVGKHGIIENNLLQQLDQLVGQIGRHERLNGDGNVLGILRLAEGRLNDLVDQLTAIGVALLQHLGPELGVATSHEITRLRLEQGVLVADGDQLAVALAAFVGHAGKMRVALFAVATDDARVVPGS